MIQPFVHGSPIPGTRPSQALVRWVRSLPAQTGEEFACEPGVAKMFDLDPDVDLVVEHLARRLPARVLLGILAAMLGFIVTAPVRWLWIRLRRDPEGAADLLALRDPEYIPLACDVLDVLHPPGTPPRRARERFRLAYSEAMAEAITARCAAIGGGRLRVLVGLGHLREIADLLS